MREFFREIVHALEEGRPVELVSIAASDGSTPRGAGAMMAVFPGGGATPCGSSALPWETPPAWAWSAAGE